MTIDGESKDAAVNGIGTSIKEKVACNYDVTFPAKIGNYGDKLSLEFTKIKNAILHVSAVKLSESITAENIGNNMFKFSPIEAGGDSSKKLPSIKVPYPFQLHVAVEPTKDFVSLSMRVKFEDNQLSKSEIAIQKKKYDAAGSRDKVVIQMNGGDRVILNEKGVQMVESDEEESGLMIIIAIVAGIVVLLIIMCSIYYCWKKRQMEKALKMRQEQEKAA